MRSLAEQLTQYAAYHRDRRNIATHFVGVPMITVAVSTLLARPSTADFGVPLSLAVLIAALAIVFYLALDLRFGLVMAALLIASTAVGQWLALQPTTTWLGVGVGLFIVGWVIQFIGHYYEGRKPAFLDDLAGLLIGPLFLVAEAAFALGLRRRLRQAIEAEVGPTGLRDLAMKRG